LSASFEEQVGWKLEMQNSADTSAICFDVWTCSPLSWIMKQEACCMSSGFEVQDISRKSQGV
jgi:hypothetical protein